MAQQHYNLPSSQDDNDHTKQRQIRQPGLSSEPLSTWVIQPSTNRYAKPQNLEYEPHQGQELDLMHIKLQIEDIDHLSLLKIAFGSYIMSTQSFLDPSTNIIHLTCTIPLWQLHQSPNRSIPLYITITSEQPTTSVLDAWAIGYFTYLSNKRSSTELSLSYDTLMKRTKPSNIVDQESQVQQQSTYILPTQANYDYSNYYGLAQHYIQPVPSSGEPSSSRTRQYFEDPTSPSQIMYTFRSTGSTETFANYGTTESLGMGTSNISQAPPPSSSSSSSSSTILPTSSYSAPLIQPQRSLSISTNIAPAVSSSTNIEIAPASVSPSSSSAPLFSPTTTTTIPSSSPFAHLPSHANLIIENNLNSMTQDWNEQEKKEDHRRLIQFWRRQQENEIICYCKPIPPTNRANSAQEIIVSCIFWEAKNDYFITSVDIIYLLEALIGVKFTTEEKNRVRRNLEGFRPLTVSKLKSDSSDFFKLIMAFNHPKPRNIEKDLKVFAWSSLPTALKKIISKYSASYSSTASVTLDPYSSSSHSPPMPHPSTST